MLYWLEKKKEYLNPKTIHGLAKSITWKNWTCNLKLFKKWKLDHHDQFESILLSPSCVLVCANTMAKCYNGSIMTILCLWYTIWQICHIYNIKAYFPLFTCLVLIWLIVLSPSAQHSWCLFLQMKRGNPVNSLHMFLGWVNAVLLLYGALISCRVKNWCRGVVY